MLPAREAEERALDMPVGVGVGIGIGIEMEVERMVCTGS